MVIFGIISAGLVVLAILFILIRLVLDWRLTAIQREPDLSPLFRRKAYHLRKLEQARHIRYLLAASLTLGVALILFISAFLILVDDHQKVRAQNQKTIEHVNRLEKQQKEMIASIPLKNYPSEGIGLKDYEWEKLSGKDKKPEVQEQIATEISQKTRPYFGSADTTVLIADAQTLSFQLKGQADDEASKETIQKNLDAFVKEAGTATELTDIHVRMITSVGKKQIIYSVNYTREKGEGEFTKQNASEQNLKNEGGKG